jgi:putative flippase GtrA
MKRNRGETGLPGPCVHLWLNHQKKVRFCLVGIWNTVFGYLAFICLDSLFTGIFLKRYAAYMSAAVLSNVLAIINAYIFHKYITFKSEARGVAIINEFIRFSTTYLVTFVLGLLLLPFSVEVLKITPKIAAALLTVLFTGISYLGHMKFSFGRPPAKNN